MFLLSSYLSFPRHLSGCPSVSLNLSLAKFHCGWGVEGRKQEAQKLSPQA